MNDQEAFAIAVEEAKISYKEGGVPVRAIIYPLCQSAENLDPRLELLWYPEKVNC